MPFEVFTILNKRPCGFGRILVGVCPEEPFFEFASTTETKYTTRLQIIVQQKNRNKQFINKEACSNQFSYEMIKMTKPFSCI